MYDRKPEMLKIVHLHSSLVARDFFQQAKTSSPIDMSLYSPTHSRGSEEKIRMTYS